MTTGRLLLPKGGIKLMIPCFDVIRNVCNEKRGGNSFRQSGESFDQFFDACCIRDEAGQRNLSNFRIGVRYDF
jgi:hypothetical protein